MRVRKEQIDLLFTDISFFSGKCLMRMRGEHVRRRRWCMNAHIWTDTEEKKKKQRKEFENKQSRSRAGKTTWQETSNLCSTRSFDRNGVDIDDFSSSSSLCRSPPPLGLFSSSSRLRTLSHQLRSLLSSFQRSSFSIIKQYWETNRLSIDRSTQANKRATVRGILTLNRVRLDRQKRTAREHSLDLLSLWPKHNQLEGSMSFDSLERQGVLSRQSFPWRSLLSKIEQEEKLVSIVGASSKMMIRMREEKGRRRRRRFSVSTIDDNRSFFSLSLSLSLAIVEIEHSCDELIELLFYLYYFAILVHTHAHRTKTDAMNATSRDTNARTHHEEGMVPAGWDDHDSVFVAFLCLWYLRQCRS